MSRRCYINLLLALGNFNHFNGIPFLLYFNGPSILLAAKDALPYALLCSAKTLNMELWKKKYGGRIEFGRAGGYCTTILISFATEPGVLVTYSNWILISGRRARANCSNGRQ